ncbi:BAR-domain-containing protein [Dendrothele bispora CBS 962.96]|uniref:BAR-domain-containing protein n=1 Tax=Dendrothele bispora (strain CBS 962.96) TaxID=1314807 RepID=A0A4S8LNB3_DENBC|nr:BAR-domain-containing protein [Dendrothele bispora CBS 962.96]
MKGFAKAVKRTPFMVTSKVGMSKKSNDPEFDDYQRHFTALEHAVEKLLKDTKAFTDSVNTLFTSGAGFATHFSTIFHPISGEYDLLGKHPEAEHTIRSVDKYQNATEELRSSVGPELELIESRIVGPTKEFQTIMKTIRKTITKRDHKLVDYDRFNNSLTKLRDKKEKSLSDEKNLFKLEQDFEVATNEYEYINTALKNDMPRFMQLCTNFIDPLFHSFFYMQLNIFYLILEKMNSFAEETKYDITNISGNEITANYEEARTDAWNEIESLNITKRIISTSKLVQSNRAASGGSGGASMSRTPSSATSSSVASKSALGKSPPPPPPSSSSFKKAPPPPSTATAAPPPYSPPTNGAMNTVSAAAAKKAPPPPPPLKPKPKLAPKPQFVVALYDFEAQAEGDLSFSVGDRIEIVERTASAEDWWTGRLNGVQGVFPGKPCLFSATTFQAKLRPSR